MEFCAHHVCIKVTDAGKSREFYRNSLGFSVESVVNHTPEVSSVFMISGDGRIRIQLLNGPGLKADNVAYGHLGMSVDDIRAAYDFHMGQGVVSQGIVEQAHQFGYFIKDQDGYETEICQLK